MAKLKTIALAGNPNSGKTTLFNEMTGSRQHVGNYPGVTVEKKEGIFNLNGEKVRIVDLPGIYSLSAYSIEEQVARSYLFKEKPDIVVNIVDASNLERNLYLTVQLMEMGINVIIALNMMDVAGNRGIEIHSSLLSTLLNVPVIEIVARSGTGIDDLIKSAVSSIDNKISHELRINYGDDIEAVLKEMELYITDDGLLTDIYPARWTAIKFLENDAQILKEASENNLKLSSRLSEMAYTLACHLESTLKTYPEALVSDYRYGYVKSVVRQSARQNDSFDRLYLTDRIDKVITHRILGPVIMVAVIYLLYKFTFDGSTIFIEGLSRSFAWLTSLAESSLPAGHLKSLIISGIIGGVGGVIIFVPLIMIMFLGIAIIEDSGYLARIAFMMDRVFRIFGLHGSSVMSYIVSGGIAGGCAVPGILATRTIRSSRERIATMLTAPFMNCGAKLPVFALLVAAFFSKYGALIMVFITAVSWAGALAVAWLLRSTVVKGEPTPFVMELPPYRLPTVKGLAIHTWERTWQYIKKAGTIILAISIVLWALMSFPSLPESSPEKGTKNESAAALKHSAAGRFGAALEPVSSLAGFDWKLNIALIGGFAAKEVIISTLGTAYSLEDGDHKSDSGLPGKIRSSEGFSPLAALSLIIFIIFYSPCLPAIACIVRESGSWKWGIFVIFFNTTLAFILSTAVYQTGRLLGY